MSINIRTKTLEVNSIRLSGQPIAYYDNSTKGGWDVTVIIDIGDGKTVRVSCPLNKEKKPYFTEAQFKKGTVAFIGAQFNSYINKRTNRPVFQIKAGGWRNILLGLENELELNETFIAGLVNQVNPKTNRFLVDVKHRKGLPQAGKPTEYGIRQIMVTCPEGVDLPSKDSEVFVTGTVSITDDGRPGILAKQIVKI